MSSPKRIILIGHCGPDSSYLRMAARQADPKAVIVAADDEQTLQQALGVGGGLYLINRQLDYGMRESMGVELIRRLKKEYPQLKMMLISNYPEAQAEAIAAGALPGFGKREIGTPRVGELIRAALEQPNQDAQIQSA